MSDIFVSYDDQDRPRVRRIVEALEARGWSVWWDHRISTGEAFAPVIERELEAASCVIVAWTNTSVHSEWVRAEADEAWKRGKLVPVHLDRVDPPMPFGQVQAADLVDWREPGHRVCQADRRPARTHREGARPRGAGNTRGAIRKVEGAVGIGTAVLLAIATIAWYFLWPPSERAAVGADTGRGAPDRCRRWWRRRRLLPPPRPPVTGRRA